VHRSFLLPTAALAGALVLGCHDATGPGRQQTTPPSSFGPSAAVERIEAGFFWPQRDDARTLGVLVGGSEAEWAAFCQGASGTAPLVWNELVVATPSGRLNLQDKGDAVPVTVYVYPGGDDPCLLVGAEVIAVGTMRLVATDNNITEEGPGAHSAGLHGTGVVTDPETGQQYRIQIVRRDVVLPNGEAKFELVSEVRLTPLH
jgi:hypothetical protein